MKESQYDRTVIVRCTACNHITAGVATAAGDLRSTKSRYCERCGNREFTEHRIHER